MVEKVDTLKKAYEVLGIDAGSKPNDIHEVYQEKLEEFKKLRDNKKFTLEGAKKIHGLKQAYKEVCENEKITPIIDVPKQVTQPTRARSSSPAASASPQKQQQAMLVRVESTEQNHYEVLGLKQGEALTRVQATERMNLAQSGVIPQDKKKAYVQAINVLGNPGRKEAYDKAMEVKNKSSSPEKEVADIKLRFPVASFLKRQAMKLVGNGKKSGPPFTPSQGQNTNKARQLD